MDLYSFLRPLFFALPAERAHHLGMAALTSPLMPRQSVTPDACLKQRIWGLDFPHPLGMAAGFDKNAEALDGLARQGFGFVEVGTVTPRAQPGNATPRLFRLAEDRAVINRFGFNNEGLAPFVNRLQHRPEGVIVGANIGKNKDSDDAVQDYLLGLRAVAPYADYVTVNISSPNTAGLRDLQQADALQTLLRAVMETRNALPRRVPLLVKIAPDLDPEPLAALVETALAEGVDGLIVSNTTLARPSSLRSRWAQETGGLSGAPLFEASTAILREVYRLTNGKLPLIGVGGIGSAQQAYAKIRAGAALVQIYSALVYEGFGLVKRIVDELPELLRRDGFAELSDAVGA